MTVRPRKALGQHFLSDPSLLARIAAATGAGPGDIVLEIGPGPGGLTAALLDRGAAVIAIERDERMRDALERRFRGAAFTLVPGDALDLDWAALVHRDIVAGKRWHVAGNIPYNITSPLLGRALSAPLPASITFLVQREVADRVVAGPDSRDYGALSIGIQALAEVRREFTVGRGAFVPRPKVDSALLHLVPRSPPLVPPERIADFRRLVTAIFSYRRKRMVKAVREATALDADAAVRLLEAAAIDPAVRPENVAVAGFIRLLDAVAEERTRPHGSAGDRGQLAPRAAS